MRVYAFSFMAFLLSFHLSPIRSLADEEQPKKATVVDAENSVRFSQLCQMRGALALLVGFESSPVDSVGPVPNLPH